MPFLSWDEYFMHIAMLSAARSKDSTQVGACLVNDRKRIVGGLQRVSQHQVQRFATVTDNFFRIFWQWVGLCD